MTRNNLLDLRVLRAPVIVQIITVVSAVGILFADQAVSKEISFNHDVRPILSDRCFHCHGPDAKNQESEFRLDSAEHAVADLGGYAGIVPGNLEASEMHARIRSTDDDRMPPLDSHRKLSEAEKDILDAWILAGAPFDEHWSFKPLPETVPVPKTGSKVARNEIDHFVVERLAAADLQLNGETSREKWLRRVTFDLTGLPPTLEELDAFLSDTSDQAHQRVVDRLLKSDACAERLTSEWLDVARYSDSYGYQRDDERYVWPYRDWVIKSFRRNMPFDEFVTWQLAGDLFPNATREQRLATVFNRLHSHKKEGGVALEEFRVENVSDRAHTVATAFMGLTLECSRCHDHKYDPLTMQDYYQLSSFFANIDERGLISYFTDAVPTPAMPLPSSEQEAKLSRAKQAVALAESKLEEVQQDTDRAFAKWLKNRNSKAAMPGLVASLSFEQLDVLPQSAIEETSKEKKKKKKDKQPRGRLVNSVPETKPATTSEKNVLVSGKQGQAIKLTGDDPVEIPEVGRFKRHEPFSISLWMKPADVEHRAVICRYSGGWDDAGSMGYALVQRKDALRATFAHFWPGNAISVEAKNAVEAGQWTHVTMTYDGSSKAAGLNIYLNGELAKKEIIEDHLTRTISSWRGGHEDLAIGSRYRDRGFKDGLVDEFRVFDRTLASLEVRQLYDDNSLLNTFDIADVDLSPAAAAELRECFLASAHQPSIEARAALEQARREWNAIMDEIPAIHIMREQETPRPAYILTRGAYDQRGEEVTADTPAFLPEFPADAPRDRLGLAQWLTSPTHPLTARVTVNRYWQMLFGEGLVRTPEDFGRQGEPPTHPELLDWLARDFVNNGWDIRQLLRMLVLSTTYRQSAIIDPAVRQLDPENRLWSRGPSQRLSSEMIRDNVLAVSGLLVNKIGGKPVKPYDLKLAYTPLPVDEGEALYRRSLYTFWKRTSPAPVMITMNSGKREVCRMKREITASPLQALVLLNGPQFIEASRVFGEKLLAEHGEEIDTLVAVGFRKLTSREPSAPEVAILRQLYDEQLAEFENHPERAEKFLQVGQARNESKASPAQVAAATVLVNTMMNLDESVRHR